MLSDRSIRALKKSNVLRADGNGLYLRVSVHGTKTFLFRSRKGGKASYLTLGEYPHLTLSEARKRVERLRGGISTMTFPEACEEYLRVLKYKHPEQVRSRLKGIKLDKRLAAITTADITHALQEIVDRGAPVQANRTLADIKHVFSFSHEKGWIHHDPSQRITRKVVGGKEESRDVVLTDDELRDFIKELRTERWEPKTRAGLALCLLTGQRASECLSLKPVAFQEIETKTRPNKVYLVPLARYIARYLEPCDHRTLSRALNRAGYRFTPHDLRRTMRTRMSEWTLPHVAEKCLGHKLEGVLSVYDRADYLPEKQEAWTRWYCYLRRLST